MTSYQWQRHGSGYWLPALLMLVLAVSIGCGSSSEAVPDYDPGGDGDDDTPPVLSAAHTGWKSTGCGGCHTLPVEGHVQTQPAQCAPCHGGNGACDPNGTNSQRQTHQTTDNCTICHQNQHGYTSSPDCVACHFATEGVDPSCQ